MKRSSMLKLIISKLNIIYGSSTLNNNAAEIVLRLCEDMGMTPPFSSHYEKDGFVKYTGNSWENEESMSEDTNLIM